MRVNAFFLDANDDRSMQRILLRAKIHRARVTEADLDYEGSISIDGDLLDLAGIAPFEKVEIYDITNGHRIETYAIVGERGSGEICVNGAAARLVRPNDLIIICCFGICEESEIRQHQARIVYVDENNRPAKPEAQAANSARS